MNELVERLQRDDDFMGYWFFYTRLEVEPEYLDIRNWLAARTESDLIHLADYDDDFIPEDRKIEVLTQVIRIDIQELLEAEIGEGHYDINRPEGENVTLTINGVEIECDLSYHIEAIRYDEPRYPKIENTDFSKN